MRTEIYAGFEILILDSDDDAQSGQLLPKGLVVARFASGWAAWDVSDREVAILSGVAPLQSPEAAVAAHRELIDGLIADRTQPAPDPDGTSHAPLANEEVVIFRGQTRIEFPADLLADVFNALPPGAPLKDAVLKAICDSGVSGRHGFVVSSDGTLRFDDVRYSVGIYRLKQARRAKNAIEQLKQAAQAVQMVNEFLDLEARADQHGMADGDALVPLPLSPRALFADASRLGEATIHDAVKLQQRLFNDPANDAPQGTLVD